MQSPNRFFGGEASTSSQVTKLSASSWQRFVQEVLGHPAIVNVTRAQFRAMSPKERHAAKRVPYVTPATFRKDVDRRLSENARDISLLCLDIDDPVQAKPFFRKPDLLTTALEPLAFAAYTTASSTVDAPKLRIMVPAEHIAVKSYAQAVRTVAKMLGLPSVTKESLVPVQPMYLPTLFRDDDPVDHHPLIIAALQGTAFTATMVDGAPPPDPTPAPDSDNGKVDDLEFLRPTVEDVTMEDAKSALAHLDPDMSYPEWLEIAAALRHQFPREADAAYKLFDAWSAKGKKYVGREDTHAKWNSLRPTPKGRMPITIRSLFSRATSAGWTGASEVAQKVYNQLFHWISDPKRSQHELLNVGVKRIVAAPLQSPVERGTLLARLKDALSLRGLKVTATDLKREMHRLERAMDRPVNTNTEPETKLPRWARGLCYVAGPNEFYQRMTDRVFSPDTLDNFYGVYLMGTDTESGRPIMRPRDYLLNVAKCPRVDNYRYDPTHPEQNFVEDGTKRYVNLYLPSYPEPEATDADEAGRVFTKHLENLISEADYRTTLLDFLCCMVQRPGVKIRWAVLLQGAQGCGKTAIAEAMAAVLGKTNVKMISADAVFSQFNPWAMGAQLVAVEEIRVVGHNRYEVMNRLKPCITNNTVSVNRKLRDLQEVPNTANYLMFTNHHDSLAVGEDDRRYFVVNSRIQNRTQVKELGGQKYFDELFRVVNDMAPGLRAWFEKRKISATFAPDGHAPMTKYLQQLTEAAATPLHAAIRDTLADKPHPLVRDDLLSSKALKSLLEVDSGIPRFTDQHLAVALRELDYEQLGRVRLGDDGQRHYLWMKRGAFKTPAAALELAHNRAEGKDPGLLL